MTGTRLGRPPLSRHCQGPDRKSHSEGRAPWQIPAPLLRNSRSESAPILPPRLPARRACSLLGSGLCGLLVPVQLGSPKQDTPGVIGRWPGLLREVWENPGSREPDQGPKGSSRAFSVTPPNKGNKAVALSETQRAEDEPRVRSQEPWGLVLALPPATCCMTLSNCSPRFPPP